MNTHARTGWMVVYGDRGKWLAPVSSNALIHGLPQLAQAEGVLFKSQEDAEREAVGVRKFLRENGAPGVADPVVEVVRGLLTIDPQPQPLVVDNPTIH